MDRPVGFVSRPFWRGTTTLQPTLEADTALGILLVVLLLTLIGWLYLDQSATITTTRAEMTALQGERDRTLLEISHLQSELATRTSTQHVVEYGRRHGFHVPQKVVALQVTPLPTMALSDPMPSLGTDGAASDDDRPWWHSALSWLESTVTVQAISQ